MRRIIFLNYHPNCLKISSSSLCVHFTVFSSLFSAKFRSPQENQTTTVYLMQCGEFFELTAYQTWTLLLISLPKSRDQETEAKFGRLIEKMDMEELLASGNNLIGFLKEEKDIVALNHFLRQSKALQFQCGEDFNHTQKTIHGSKFLHFLNQNVIFFAALVGWYIDVELLVYLSMMINWLPSGFQLNSANKDWLVFRSGAAIIFVCSEQ